MATEFILSYTGSEINNKLGKIDDLVKDEERLSSEIKVERARINSLASLSEGSTTSDAELIDLRIGADGVTYESAGEAIRSQFDELVYQVESEYITLPFTYRLGESINSENGFNYSGDSAADTVLSDFIRNEGVLIKFNGNATDANGKNFSCYLYEYREATAQNQSYLNKRYNMLDGDTIRLSDECGYFRFTFGYAYGEADTIDEKTVNENCKFIYKPNVNELVNRIEETKNRIEETKKQSEEIRSLIKDSSVLFYDDFTGTTLDTSKWDYGRVSSTEDEIESKKENVFIENGELKIRACKSADGTWSTGQISTIRKFSFGKNTKITVRAKFPTEQGSWGCIWSHCDNFPTVPPHYDEDGVKHSNSESTWPYGGEIDISEKMGKKNETNASIHFYNGKHDTVTSKTPITSDDWHEYWCIYTEDKIELGVDGITTLSADISTFTGEWENPNNPGEQVSFNPFTGEQVSQYLILGLQVGKDSENGFAPAPDSTTPDEFFACFDYVKVEALTPKHEARVLDLTMGNEGVDDEITLLADGKYKVLRPFLDELAQDRTIYYHSLNPDVCEISREGKIKGVSAGSTYIYVLTHGSASKRVKVTVTVTEN